MEIDEEAQRCQVPLDETDVPTLRNADDTLGVIEKHHLDSFIAGWKLKRLEQRFPQSYGEVTEMASAGGVSGNWFCIADLAEVGLPTDRLAQAIKFVGPGTSPWSGADFDLWVPTTDVAPFVLETNHTPAQWLIEREWGDRDEFREQFGATSCVDCEEVFEEPVVECPECGDYPEAVMNNLDGLMEKHPGVAVIMSPRDVTDG